MFVFFDFEVFKYDWLVVFKPLNQEPTIIVNDYKAVEDYFNNNKQVIYVGFNNKNYDNNILKGILSGIDPWAINNWIIEDKKDGWQFPGLKRINIMFLDMVLDITGAVGLSLKEIEGNMGLEIKESDVDFTTDRKLTREEIDDVIKYCIYDVKATEALFHVRQPYVKSKLQLLRVFGLPLTDIGKTNAQMSAEALQPIYKTFDDELTYDIPSNLKLNHTEYLTIYQSPLDYKNNLIVDICGVEHKLAFGGLHGAVPKSVFEKNIIHLDVTSYYPSLMIEYNYLSRRVKDPSIYKKIYDQRIKWKAEQNPDEQAFKLVLNTTYGATKYKYSRLYDPKQANQVCISGQLFLIDLLEKLEPYITLIQSNTDGLIVQCDNVDLIKPIIKEWEDRTRFRLSIKTINKIWQKDVNNYIMLIGDQIKVKGGYVVGYNGGNFVRNTTTIIDKAIVDYLVYNIPPEQTILNCDDPIRFQIITKKGPTFNKVKKVVYEDGVEKHIDTQNVNRVFAVKDSKYGKIIKYRPDNTFVTVGSLPDHCYIHNDHINSMDVNLIDKQWYIDQAKSKIKDFG